MNKKITRGAFGQAGAVAQDAVSGLLVALLTLSYCFSFAALIFSGPLAAGLGAGIAAVILGAGVTALLAAATSSMPRGIAGPDAPVMAVLGIVAATTAKFAADGSGPVLVLGVLSFATALTGAVLYALGTMRMGRWVRYIPFPVVGGVVGASGWLLVSGGVQVLSGRPLTLLGFQQLVEGPSVPPLAAGLAIATILFSMRATFRNPLALPVTMILCGAACHGGLALAGMSPEAARAAGWLLPVGAIRPQWFAALPALADSGIGWHAIFAQGAELGAVVAVTALCILLNATGLEVVKGSSADFDRELKSYGLANLAAGAMGGLIGSLCLSRSLLNLQAGARSRLSGMFAGLWCLLALGAGSEVVGAIPIPLVGGILLHLGVTVMTNWLYKMRARFSASDYGLLLVILLIVLNRGYLEGAVIGVVVSCLAFAAHYSRVPVVKHHLTRREYGSYVQRSPEETGCLVEHGDQIQVLWLQGFLFFGTSSQLVDYIMRLATNIRGGGVMSGGSILLDFQQVTGSDSSATFGFLKLRNFAARRGLNLVFSNLPPDLEEALAADGFFGEDGVSLCFADLDLAAEWCENKLLEQRFAGAPSMPGFEEWLALGLGDVARVKAFMGFLDWVMVSEGEYLFQTGQESNAVFLILSGRVSVIAAPPGGRPVRLRSLGDQTVVGELGFYGHKKRTLSAIADLPTVCYRLTRPALERMRAAAPDATEAFHTWIVNILEGRLSFATNEIAALQRQRSGGS